MSNDSALHMCFEELGLLNEDLENGPWVDRSQVVQLAKTLKEELDYRFFVYCAAAHVPAVEDEEAPVAEHFVVAYRLRRLGPGSSTASFQIRVPMGETTPSLAQVYAGADWQEREQFDLVGVVFEGHPDLRRIMMPEDWIGHPLQRDYSIDTPHHPWR